MNVYQKLNEARQRFHQLKLEKTGHNKFAGYNYFELGDFLIPALKVFDEVGLCAYVSFEKDVAQMCIRNIEKPDEFIALSSPMGSAALKGCHEVQNIGAVETYQRRYLWVAALEIVEHDALDATTGKEKPEKRETPPLADESDPFSFFTPHSAKAIRSAAQAAIQAFNEGNEWTAYEEASSCIDKLGGDDETIRNQVKLALNHIFRPHSALRASLKKSAEQDRKKEPA